MDALDRALAAAAVNGSTAGLDSAAYEALLRRGWITGSGELTDQGRPEAVRVLNDLIGIRAADFTHLRRLIDRLTP